MSAGLYCVSHELLFEALIQIMSVGRGLDPADPVPVFDWYVEWFYFRNYHGKHAAKIGM